MVGNDGRTQTESIFEVGSEDLGLSEGQEIKGNVGADG